MSKVGDSRLFVLSKNPDGATYGLQFGPYSRFKVDSNVVVYSDLAHSEVKFARGISPADFIKS